MTILEAAQTSQSTPSSAWRIRGGTPLEGTVDLYGAKNAISKQLIASLLTTEPCFFSNVPRIAETTITLEMLSELGTQYEWLTEHTLRVETPHLRTAAVPDRFAGLNRVSVLFLAPLLHRAGEARVPVPGGDAIGVRPVDFHLDGLKKMGAEVSVDGIAMTGKGGAGKPHGWAVGPEGVRRTRADGPLKGSTIQLPYPSVGATEQLILAGTLARGTTVIANAAVEPEIIDTVCLLQQMGAQIAVETDRRIVVEGVPRLRGASHRVVPDRIEAASFACLAVATGGRVAVRNARQDHVLSFINHLQRLGGGFSVDTVEGDVMTFFRRDALRAIHLETDVHPGFLTDWQQPFVAMMTQATGMSVVHETVHEERFGYIEAFQAMGAEIQPYTDCLGSKPCRYWNADRVHSCVVRGPTQLSAAHLTVPDIRAGFAYLVAALVAEGTSELTGVHHLERGYADLIPRLRSLGVQIEVS
ncbi:MAG TPA: UDP-N-acetylglucosamine 1-carboxyvinyltransferase [Chloroflexota bacterium]|nr:UDP-N-acetylglucosamine 1-carboxyvinyltransferase [Chloroflexota bacterium]